MRETCSDHYAFQMLSICNVSEKLAVVCCIGLEAGRPRDAAAGGGVFYGPSSVFAPPETIFIRASDVILPLAEVHARYHSVGVVVASRERQITTKSRTHDETMLVDGACRPDTAAVL